MDRGDRPAELFCRSYLRSMDPEQAEEAAGYPNGFSALESKNIRRRLERMREAASGQIRREDAVRRLAQLAFGRVNDAAQLAFYKEGTDLKKLDLSAVSELKVTDKGGVEIKLIDRIRALEALCGILGEGTAKEAGALLQALTEAAGSEEEWSDG